MALELHGVAKWIYANLSGSSLLTDFVKKHPTEDVWNIYEGDAIQGATYPMIVFQYMGGSNRDGTGGRRVFNTSTYQIKAIDENPTSFADLESISNEFDTLFQQAQDVVDPVVAGSRPLHAVQHIEIVDGKRRNHLGIMVSITEYNQSGS